MGQAANAFGCTLAAEPAMAGGESRDSGIARKSAGVAEARIRPQSSDRRAGGRTEYDARQDEPLCCVIEAQEGLRMGAYGVST